MKTRLRWLLIAALLLLIQAKCEHARAAGLQLIMKSRTVKELNGAIEKASRLEMLRLDCSAELAGEALPRSCFEALKLEDRSHQQLWLSRLCESRAKKLNRLEDFDHIENLPPTCREVASQRREDLRYQYEERKPQALFLEHVRKSDLGSDLE